MTQDSRSKTRDRVLASTLVLPAIVFLLLLNVFPLIYNIILAFTDADLTGGSRSWVGLTNFRTILAPGPYWGALVRSGLFTLLAVSLELALGFSLALALKDRFRFQPLVLSFLLIPMMLSPAVMGLYWSFLLNGQYGILNQVLAASGLPQPQWITDPSLKFFSILMVDVWMWTPYMMLICLAGLQSIPSHLYEAAEVDRASAKTVFFRITLPLAAPFLFLAALFRATDALKQFDLVMAITGPGDPATQTLSVLLYQKLFQDSRLGLSSAYACLVLILVITLSSGLVRALDRTKAAQGRA